MYKSMLTVLAGLAILAAACSRGGVSVAPTISITPGSSPSDPINLSKNNLFPGDTATLKASESGYSGNYTAVSNGSCISVDPVPDTVNEFSINNAGNCGGQNVRVVISDTLGHSATSYVTND